MLEHLRAQAGRDAAGALRAAIAFADAILAGDERPTPRLAGTPFNRARLDLARGRRLAGLGQSREARAALERAGQSFDTAGAPGWSERVRERLSTLDQR